MNPLLKLLLKQKISTKEIYTAFEMSRETFRKKIEPLRVYLNGDSERKRTYTQDEFRFIIDNIKWEKDKPSKKRN